MATERRARIEGVVASSASHEPTRLGRGGTPARAVPYAVAAVLLGLLAGCGADDDGDSAGAGPRPEAQPAPDVSVFTEGGFDEVPVPPRADPAGPRSEVDGVVARSYSVRNSSVDEVLEFYRGQLSDWDEIGVEDVGSAVRADFERERRALRLTVQPSPTLSGEDPRLQLTLQLGPSDAVFEATGPAG